MESFWARMQVELLNRKRWNTRLELANAIFEYLEIFHNRQRRHSSLGMLSPIEYELRHADNIAHIASDGTLDTDFAAGTNGPVYTLAVSDTTLFAGGFFDTAGGQPRAKLAGFDRATGAVSGFNPGVTGTQPSSRCSSSRVRRCTWAARSPASEARRARTSAR